MMIPPDWTRLGPGVFASSSPVVSVDRSGVEALKTEAASTPLRRARLCAHRVSDDLLHEMVIVLAESTYVRPHCHLAKSESYHVIEGQADLIIFNEAGAITEVIRLGGDALGGVFFCRIPERVFHTLIVRTRFFVVHETTNGPLNRAATFFADWAPTAEAGGEEFLASLHRRLEDYRATL